MKIVATGLSLLVAGAARADVIVHLQSGNEMRALRTWTEGDVVKIQLRSGVVAFPASQVAKIEHAPAGIAPLPASPPAETKVAPAHHDGDAPGSNQAPAGQDAAKDKKTPPPMTVEGEVPEVAGEDLKTKMERLDGLSMQTHRQLSIARTQGQSKETLETLQGKIDEINEQRAATMRKLQGKR